MGVGMGSGGGGPVMCPVCRTTDNVAAGGPHKGRLASKLASGPNHTGDGCMHFIEGIIIAAMAAGAGKYYADDRGWPWLIPVGLVVAVLIVVGTIALVRSEGKDKRRAQAGRPRAAEIIATARYCSTCEGVFFPRGVPFAGVLAPEQFRHYVWTEAGYGDQLDPEAKAAEPPLKVVP